MAVHDDLGKRMKTNYEEIPKIKLVRRMPVIIRIDGRAFHSFTKGLDKPFDNILIESMQDTMKYLCKNTQGCVLGYHQSDEISLLLIDYQKLNSEAFFDYEVQKLCSITASMATMAFNNAFERNYVQLYRSLELSERWLDIVDRIANKSGNAMFDSRCFNIPKEEVANYFYWRQLDAIRNSIQMVGQSQFSHKELHGKSCNMIQEMLHEQKGINWNDFPVYQKRGSCCIKTIDTDGRSNWIIDKNIPDFVNEGREYIERLIEP